MLILLNFATFSIGLFVFLLFLFSKEKILPFKLVSIHFAYLLFVAFNNILFEAGYINQYPFLINLCAPLVYLSGPLNYLFIRTILYNEKKLKRKDYLHFLPFAIHLISLLPFYFSENSYKLQLLNAFLSKGNPNWIEITANETFAAIHNLVKFLIGFSYLLFSFKTLQNFKRKADRIVIIENEKLLGLFSRILWIKVFIHSIAIIGLIFMMFKIDLRMIVFNSSMFVIIAFNIYQFLLNPKLLYGMQYSFTYSSQEEFSNNDFLIAGLKSGPFDESLFIDKNYHIVHFNRSSVEPGNSLLNKSVIKGNSIYDYLPGDSKNIINQGLSTAFGGVVFETDHEIIFNGMQFWRHLKFQPIHGSDEDVFGVVLTSKDITQMKLDEIRIEQFKKILNEIIWRQSHLLRAPIANIQGMSSLLLKPDSILKHDEKIDLLKHVHAEIKRLEEILSPAERSAADAK